VALGLDEPATAARRIGTGHATEPSMRSLLLLLASVSMTACSAYHVAVHASESDHNHFVLVKSRPGSTDHVFDCYSKPDAKWEPTCREVAMQEEWPGKVDR
jgi:hypothetical protein